MSARRTPLFLARRTYRRRRLMDGARMLPVLGAFFVLLPILWVPADGAGQNTARDGVYLFAVWAALIVLARLLAPGLVADEDSEEEEDI